MKILIITGIFPPDIGGPASYVPQIAKGLVERGHGITVVTLADWQNRETGNVKGESEDRSRETRIAANGEQELEIRGQRSESGDQRSEIQNPKSKTGNPQSAIRNPQFPYPVILIPRQLFKPWRWLRTIWIILRLGRKADVLFVNGIAMEAVLANLLLRKPMVQKVVGDLAWERATNKGWVRDSFEEFQKRRYGVKVELLKALRSWWTRKADRVIVPSRYLAGWVARWGIPDNKIAVVYNALEPRNDIKPAKLALQSPMNVVTVGRLVSWKGIDQVLETIAQLQGVGLVVVGDGPERRNLEERTHVLGIASRVYFAGQRSHDESLSYMAACDIFVLNSSYEGLPHVILEAMSLGLPIVASSVGGVVEVVRDGENGYLVERAAGKDLLSILARLLSNPADRERLVSGARRKLQRFTFSTLLDTTESVLRDVIRGHSQQDSIAETAARGLVDPLK